MWTELLRAAIVATLLLYVPGHLFFRGLGLSRLLALACAPLYGVCAYATLPIVYYELQIPCSPTSVLVPVVLVAAAMYAFGAWRGQVREPIFTLSKQGPLQLGRPQAKRMHVPFDVAVPLAYIALAFVVCLWVYLSQLPRASAFFPRFDNQTHLNLIRSFVDCDKWSSLHVDVLASLPEQARPWVGAGSFYPAAWHCVVALTALIAGVAPTVGVNAVVSVVASVVFPLSCYAFMRVVFPHKRLPVLFGAIASTGFATWPWLFTVTGPLYPNQLGLSMLLGALAVVMVFVRGSHGRMVVLRFVVFSLVTLVALALAHPSTVFSAYVFLAAYGLHVVWEATGHKARADDDADLDADCDADPAAQRRRLTSRRSVRVLAYVLAVVGFWVLCYHAPVMQAVVSYEKDIHGSPLRAMGSIFLLKFGALPLPQIGMLIVTWIGCLALVRTRRFWWLVLPSAFFGVAVVLVSWNDTSLFSHLFGGFWYSDVRRLGVNVCLFLIPAAAVGLSVLYVGDLSLFAHKSDQPANKRVDANEHTPPDTAQTRPSRLVLASRLVLVVALVAVYAPFVRVQTKDGSRSLSQLQHMGEVVASCYGDADTQVYNAKEVSFVNQAMELIPHDAVVINYAPDGSVWAYGVNGIGTVFRTHIVSGQTPQTKTIRKSLNEYATSPKVQDAVRSTGASYVLLLDKGATYADGDWVPQFKVGAMKNWKGIAAVDDNTPGFTCVLAQDDMRLYKIDAL